MKRHIKKFIAVLLSLLGLVLLFLVLLIAFIQTGPGQRFLEKTFNDKLVWDQGRMEIRGISGRIPFNFEVEKIFIEDDLGRWLSISQAKIDWSFAKLLSREIHVFEVGADSVDLTRLPEVEPREEETPSPARDIKWSWPLPPLTVEKLYLNTVEISDQILDEYLKLSLEGSILADDQGFSLASLEVSRIDKPTSMVSLRAGLTRDPYYLDMDLWVFDSGALESFIEIEHWPSEVSLGLKGSGPLKSWQGELTLDGQDVFNAGLHLEVEEDDFYFLSFKGDVYVSPLLFPEQGLDFTRDPFSLFVKVGLDQSRRIVLDNLDIHSPRIGLKANGLFEPSEKIASGSLNAEIPDINPLLMDSGFESQSPVNIEVDFKGPVNKLSADSRVFMANLSGHGLSLRQATITTDFKLEPSAQALYSVAGNLELSGLGIQQYPKLPEDFDLYFKLDHSTENILILNTLDIQAQDLKAALKGNINLESMEFSVDLEAYAHEAHKLIPGLPHEPYFKSDLDAAVKGRGNIRNGIYLADLDISMPAFYAEEPLLMTLIGDRPSLAGNLKFDDQLALHIAEARLDAKEFGFAGSGNMGFKDMDMDFSGELDMASLTGLGEAMDLDIAGELNVDLAAKGKISEPDLRALIRVLNFQYDELDAADLEADIKAAIMDGLPSGNLELSIYHADEQLDLWTEFALQQHALEITNFSARGMGLEVKAQLDFDLEKTLARGNILANSPDLSSLGDFLDLDISGILRSEIHLAAVQDDQDISFTLSGDNLKFDELSISSIEGAGRLEKAYSQRLMHSDLTISGFRALPAEIDLLTANVEGVLDNIKFSTSLTGNVLHPLDLSIRGSYSAQESKHAIELSELSGVYAHEHFHLDSSTILEHSTDKTSLSPFNLVLGSGILSAEGEFSRDELKAAVNLKGLDLHQIPVETFDHIMGVLALELELSGSPDRPALKANINIDGLAPAAPHLEIPHALDLIVQASLDSGQAKIESTLTENQTSLARFDLNLPMDFSITPFNVGLPQTVPLSGELQTNLELETLAMLFLPPDQLLSGTFSSQFIVSGILSEPSLTGQVEIKNASYENLDAGLYLSDLQVKAMAQQTRITITEIRGSDGLNGRIRGSGFFDIDPSKDMPWSLEMDIYTMRLVNQKLAVVYVDQGFLEASGDKSQASVTGKITFDPVNVNVPEQAPPGVVDLKVAEINDTVSREIIEEPPPGVEYPVELDLELVFPSRVYVRGRGLDSEWAGNLTVLGEATRPSVRGNLNIVRGRLEILDRRFNLSRESIINLDGTFPPDPFVDIKADYRHRDKTINVRVYGPALEPEIELSSEPPMPQDEILAWVLFGRDLSSITPFQAITLVNAARALATGQTGPDMMGGIRDFIGVDDIDIARDPEEGYTQFGLGKYVHEKVYVEVKKGTAPGTDSVSVEVELTPRISLESSVESDSDGGIGLFWKYDY